MIATTELHETIMGYACHAYIDPDRFQLCLMDWSGRQTDIAEFDKLIAFIQQAKASYQAAQTPQSVTDEAQPPLSSSIRDAVEEAIAEEQPAYLTDQNAFEDMIEEARDFNPEWTEPATEEDLASQSSDSGDHWYYDEDDDDYYYEER